jgi:hypothetical protein
MSITEEPLPSDVRASIPGAAKEGAALVGVSLDDEPIRIIEAINEFVAKPKKGSWFKRIDNWNDRAMPLGALWGTQMVRRFGWDWTFVVDREEDFKAIAVFHRNRSVGIYPFDYVFGCLESDVYPTILLAYNMLEAGSIPTGDARAYVNLMDGVRHIVTPR